MRFTCNGEHVQQGGAAPAGMTRIGNASEEAQDRYGGLGHSILWPNALAIWNHSV